MSDSQYFCTSWGQSTQGQLGTAQITRDQLLPHQASQVVTIDRKLNFIDIACGENHTVFLSQNYQLLSCGSNTYGQLGIEQAQGNSVGESLQKVAEELKFESIACGSEHSFGIAAETGELYAWGLNFIGQLGLCDYENRSEPCQVLSINSNTQSNLISQTESIASSAFSKNQTGNSMQRSKSKEPDSSNAQNHRYSDGQLMASNGAANKQQLGQTTVIARSSDLGGASKQLFNQSARDLKQLRILENGGDAYYLRQKEKVIQVACGAVHTLIRTNMDRVFSCGNGSTFALGHGTRDSLNQFRQIELPEMEVKMIACGLSHSGLITTDGQVYIWGLQGNIAQGKKLLEHFLLRTPKLINFKHLFEREPGSNRRKSTTEAQEVSKAHPPQIEDLHLGEYFSLAQSKRGYVYSWGSNDLGQLGIVADQQYSIEPVAVTSSKNTLSKAVSAIACGMKHALALTKDNQLYAWGSNQQCQLGTPTQKTFSKQPVHLKQFESSKVFKMACGSYHNFAFSQQLPSVLEREVVQVQAVQQPAPNAGTDKQGGVGGHKDEDCPNVEAVRKLKSEVKRLRQELILNPKKRKEESSEEDQDQLDEDEKTALRMLSDEQRKIFIELEEAGANPKYLKKKLKQALQSNKQFFSNEARAFIQNCEIPYNQLQFDHKLSEGGYGIVHRGRWKHTVVAIKEIKKEIIEQEKLEEFKNECAVMEVIRHPNVVLFLGACTKQPNLCIVLEYCSRGSLWSLLHDLSIKMTWEYRKKFALDIAKGVYYLHTNSQPILHRDLKSLNVLLDHALTAKLADFGWTRIKAKVMTSKIGTYQWMAPEVIRGFKYTEKADVFSFAVIMWELATRKPPYYGIDGSVVSQRVVKEGLRPKISEKEAPGPFLELMRKCWDEDPDKRPFFGEIITELQAMNFKNLG